MWLVKRPWSRHTKRQSRGATHAEIANCSDRNGSDTEDTEIRVGLHRIGLSLHILGSRIITVPGTTPLQMLKRIICDSDISLMFMLPKPFSGQNLINTTSPVGILGPFSICVHCINPSPSDCVFRPLQLETCSPRPHTMPQDHPILSPMHPQPSFHHHLFIRIIQNYTNHRSVFVNSFSAPKDVELNNRKILHRD
jgi:hypothetical protein